MNIFEALRRDHDTQRRLLDTLVDTSGDSAKRKEIFQELKIALENHADAEERFFYVPLIDQEKTQEKARHSIAEHHEIDEYLEKLEKTAMDSSAWLKIAKNLKERVEHHLAEEEHEVFQLAGKVFTEDQKQSLANDYTSFMRKNT